MYEPGQRIQIIESSFKRGTGPLVGSIGFVSEIHPVDFGVHLHRAVWIRYGKGGKPRLETSSFTVFPTTLSKEAKSFTNKYIGTPGRCGSVEIIPDKRRVDELPVEELRAWLFSLFRINIRRPVADKILNEAQLPRQIIRPRTFKELDFDENLLLRMLTAGRKIKDIHMREIVRNITPTIRDLNTHIRAVYERYDFSPKVMARHVFGKDGGTLSNRGGWYHLYHVCSCLNFVNLVNKEVSNLVSKRMRNKKHFNELHSEWKRYCGIK